ncbi:hypothetical protein [Cryobacterium sp. PAMC25264]|uniref:hypothetical protein n=1 Tax=Cryobacterium sp. PAMC25264 TaxID=2861288 RepID=UPI001C62FF91|nr:hypothetical protein [Cryobacterium sp. PAMC25264]QYF74505.1 hypothetical protein KY500_04730 [Cryobacterium sp. PAMC25264]
MTRTRVAAAAVLLLMVLPVVGCAHGAADTEALRVDGEATAVPAAPAVDRFGCGITVTPALAVVGENVVVSRGPVSPGDVCTTLAPGTIQTIELRSSHWNDVARQTAPATVAADGSFEATLTVPLDIRLGQVQITVIPPAESDCTEAAIAAGTPDDCYFPGTSFTAQFAPESLSPVRIVTTEAETPAPPLDESDSYALAGPGPDELTLVIYGSACPSRPAGFVHDAAGDTLKIVSASSTDICAQPRVPWTTVIEVPDAYRDYRSVSVDNLETTLINQ